MTASRNCSPRWARLVALACSIAGLAGCPSPDPEGKFDDFLDKTEDERDEFAKMKLDMGSMLADVNGTFLFAIEPSFQTGRYLQFIATTTLDIPAGGGEATMSIEFQPLSLDMGSSTEPREPVGDPILAEGILVSPSGSFRVESLGGGPVMVTGEANPITGSDITAMIGFEGFIQSDDLYCGNVFGDVTSPVPLALAGSTFGAVRIEATDPASLPTEITSKCPDDAMPPDGAETGESATGTDTGG
jgi:hypothetical protein